MGGKKGEYFKENRLEIVSCEAGFLKWLTLNWEMEMKSRSESMEFHG